MTTTELIVKAALGVLAIILIAIGVVWFIGGTVGTRLHRWRPDDTDAEQRARDFVLGDHPDDDPLWAPWDVALIARGICPIHVPAPLGSSDCNDDCPTAISKTVADAAMDALDSNVHYGTPMPTQAAVWAEAFAAQPTGPCPVHLERTHGDCPRCQATTPRRAEPDADWMWRVPSSTGFSKVPIEQVRDDLKAAFEDRATARRQWSDPNAEVEPDHDDTIPVSPWDTKPPGFGRIVPTQRDGSES
jgi:hypothetical protein